jgi:benzylsuccinate CoA-transferase BbsF subunit
MGSAGRYRRSKSGGQRAGANIGRTREIWPCADGWVSFGLRGGKARVPSLETISRLVGDPVLTQRDWSTFDHLKATDEDLAAIERVVGGWFAGRTMRELYELACETNLMLAPVNTARELYASAQLEARRFFDDGGTPRRWCHPRLGGTAPLRPRPSAAAREGAWAGTHILEFGAGAAGPIATRYFAEHGAAVIRVESGSRPDFLRTGSYADMFDALNCGKRSVTLNLKHPDGHALARRLVVEWADAVEENFAPRAMKGLGLAYDNLVVDRPDLVMVSACLNGQTGPHRDYPGFGGQGSALAGFNHLTGWPDREPIGPFGTITDSLAPRFVATALAAALLHRRRTGQGSYVDVSQVECAVWTLSEVLLDYRRTGHIADRRGNDHPGAVLHGVYACEGLDRWLAVAAWTPDDLDRLASVVGGADVESLCRWAATRPPLACAEALQAAGVEAVPVQDFGDVHDDPQLAHRGHFVSLEHPDLGPGDYERNGFRLRTPAGEEPPAGDELPAGYGRAGPVLGQDTTWVLGEILGLTTSEQGRLRDSGALS